MLKKTIETIDDLDPVDWAIMNAKIESMKEMSPPSFVAEKVRMGIDKKTGFPILCSVNPKKDFQEFLPYGTRKSIGQILRNNYMNPESAYLEVYQETADKLIEKKFSVENKKHGNLIFSKDKDNKYFWKKEIIRQD